MFFQLIFAFSIFTVSTLFLSALVIFIFSSPFLIRSLRIKNLAKKYGLTFKSNIKFKIFESKEERMNICEGNISGKKVKFFDAIDYDGFSVSPLNKNAKISSRETIIIIDGEKSQVKDSTLFGYATVGAINNVLLSLKQNNKVEKYLINDSNKNIPITYVFYVMIIIIAFVIYLTKLSS